MKNNERFMPKYMIEVKDEKTKRIELKVISPEKLYKILKKLGAGNFIKVWRSWIDPRTGAPAELKEYKVGLTAHDDNKKPLVEFQVYRKDEITRKMKWITMGTVALSSFLAGRDCPGCEGRRYTLQLHDDIAKQILLNSPKAKENRLTSIFLKPMKSKK
jgi:hypothetical protein